MERQRERESEAQGDMEQRRQRAASRSASGMARKHKIQKILGVLSDCESENHEHRETCSSDIEQTQPPAEDDFSLDVIGGILDLRPSSQQGKRWNLSDRKDQRELLWLIRKKGPKFGKCILFCAVLYHGSCTISVATHYSSLPCMTVQAAGMMSSTRMVTQEAGVTENE